MYVCVFVWWLGGFSTHSVCGDGRELISLETDLLSQVQITGEVVCVSYRTNGPGNGYTRNVKMQLQSFSMTAVQMKAYHIIPI